MHWVCTIACSLIGLVDPIVPSPPPDKTHADETHADGDRSGDQASLIHVPLSACKLRREQDYTVGLYTVTTRDLAFKGSIRVGVETFDIYLPNTPGKFRSGSLIQAYGHDVGYASTYLAVDQDRDGKIAAWESYFAEFPLRVGDRMFDVESIAADGSSISLRPSSAPLVGAVVGRRAPEFSFRTIDGRTLNLRSYRGRALMIAFWEPGCTACWKNFPFVKGAIDFVDSQGIDVLLVTSAGSSREERDRYLGRYGMQSYPSIVLSGRAYERQLFSQFGQFGCGYVVVGVDGNLAGVNVRSQQLVSMLKEAAGQKEPASPVSIRAEFLPTEDASGTDFLESDRELSLVLTCQLPAEGPFADPSKGGLADLRFEYSGPLKLGEPVISAVRSAPKAASSKRGRGTITIRIPATVERGVPAGHYVVHGALQLASRKGAKGLTAPWIAHTYVW